MTTMIAEPASALESTNVVEPTGASEPARGASVVRRVLCSCCRCPRPVPEPREASGSRKAAPHAASGGAGGAATECSHAEEQLVTLLPGLEGHPSLDYTTLAYHAEQADATARDGYLHAAINEARSFLQVLVINIALEEERPGEESIADFRKRKEAHCGIPSCCRFLEEIGFFNLDERVMVQHAYTLDRIGGIRQGVVNKAWSRLVRRMIRTAGEYVIQRYDAWRSGCHC